MHRTRMCGTDLIAHGPLSTIARPHCSTTIGRLRPSGSYTSCDGYLRRGRSKVEYALLKYHCRHSLSAFRSFQARRPCACFYSSRHVLADEAALDLLSRPTHSRVAQCGQRYRDAFQCMVVRVAVLANAGA